MFKWYDDEITQGILHKKYLHEGENNIHDLINRVSSIYSDDIREDVKQALYNADICPAGRTLYGAGRKGKQKVSISNCFTEDAKVLTTCGIKRICDVVVGDNVVTETGVYPVERVFKREYSGDLIKISSKTLLEDIICTPNHKLLTKDGWAEAESLARLSNGSTYLKYHSGIDISSYTDYGKVDLLSVKLNNAKIVETSDGKLQFRKFVANKGDTHCWSTFGNPVNRFIDIDDDFMYFIGRWIGDGSITKRQGADYYTILQIVFNAATEMEAAKRIIEIGINKFGIKPSTRLVEEQNTFVVRFESPIIGEFFETNFGHGCSGKHLPDKFLGNKYILYGILDSDGCVTSVSSIQLVMKNKGLIDWVRKSLAMLGVFCADSSPTEHADTWKICISSSFATQKLLPFLTKTYNDTRMSTKHMYNLLFDYARVDSAERIALEKPIFVYNLQIAADHTYNVNNVVVHNCYVIGNVKEDTLEAISQADYEVARIGSMGGGIGFAVDNIRPKGSKINNAAVESDGVAFVMRKINQTGQIVGQQGRGLALMCALSCNHPDIYEFLNIKKNHEALESMNISIKFTDDFMQSVVNNEDYELYFKVESTGEEIKKTINAREFFEEMCKVSWDTGDPGVIFIDRVRNYALTSGYPEYVIDVCNPCGEYMANDGNSCLLQSINLYNIVDNKFTDNAEINYEKFEHLIRLSVKMMNKTQDYGYDMQPLDKNRKNIDDWRSIGLGVFGLADMFVAMKVKYGSKESISLVSDVFDFMNRIALDESCNEAKKYGTYGKYDWNKQKESPIIKALRLTQDGCKIYDKIEKYGLRNSSILSVAPTGTISLFMGKLSGGCEPLFKLWYDRTSHQGENKNVVFRVMARSVEDLIKAYNLPANISRDDLISKCPWLVESHDIAPKDRVHLQSVMQEYVDNSISSTVNLPHDATWEDIYNIYIDAWKQGCKGITVFRDGCSRANILGVDTNKESEDFFKYDSIKPISRRDVVAVNGTTYRLKTACVDKFYIHVNKNADGELFEVFANPSSGCQANISTITRLISTALRSGVKVSEIIKNLKEMKCPACQALRKKGEKDIELSCGNAMAKALEMSYTKEDSDVVNTDSGLYECPECGHKTLKLEAKCAVCSNCGYSKCE